MASKKINFNFKVPSPVLLLGFVFVVAKLMAIGGVETWSWWLVLLPFYFGWAVFGVLIFGGAAITALTAAALGVVYGVCVLIEKYQYRKRRIINEKAKFWSALSKKE